MQGVQDVWRNVREDWRGIPVSAGADRSGARGAHGAGKARHSSACALTESSGVFDALSADCATTVRASPPQRAVSATPTTVRPAVALVPSRARLSCACGAHGADYVGCSGTVRPPVASVRKAHHRGQASTGAAPFGGIVDHGSQHATDFIAASNQGGVCLLIDVAARQGGVQPMTRLREFPICVC